MTDRDTSMDHRTVDWAVEIIGMCEPIRCIQGGMWFGRNRNMADATFVDYGAADAFAVAAKSLPALLAVQKAAYDYFMAAEEAHANCTECDGEEVPELCPKCFPLYDDARLARRRCLALTQAGAKEP